MTKVPEYNLPKFPPVPITKSPPIFKKPKAPKKDHLKDIDFRSREVRQNDHIKQFKECYIIIANRPFTETNQAQLMMLSAVLWHLLPKTEYKKLVTSKKDLAKTETDIQMEIVQELSWT